MTKKYPAVTLAISRMVILHRQHLATVTVAFVNFVSDRSLSAFCCYLVYKLRFCSFIFAVTGCSLCIWRGWLQNYNHSLCDFDHAPIWCSLS